MPRGTERIRRSRSSLRLRARTAGGRSDLGERTPRRSPAGPRTRRAGSGLQFLLSNWVAATSKWGHRPASGDLWIISLPGVSFVDAWGGRERAVGPLVRLGSSSRHQPRRAGTSGDAPAYRPVGVSGPSPCGSTRSPRSRPKGGPASRRSDEVPRSLGAVVGQSAQREPRRGLFTGRNTSLQVDFGRPAPRSYLQGRPVGVRRFDPVGGPCDGSCALRHVGRLGRCQCCEVAWGHE